MELDRWFWSDANHVSVKAVWDALCAYCYLPRLLDEDVFADAVRAGVQSGDYFGFATSVSDDGRYEGLTFGEAATVHVDAASVLVKADAAHPQIEATRPTPTPEPGGVGEGRTPYDPGGKPTSPPPPALPKRFYGTVEIDPDRAGRDMGDVAEEVLQNLTTLPGAKVRVTVEIEADIPDGVPVDVQRVVDENSRTLGFKGPWV